ncbi:MAG: redox-regulated ATPase YchF [Armatimonadota bacterium]|nr:redox-regulated ATPase YchF [Armatimonadota bacterium]
MKVGIVGLPGSGKTSLFQALTRGAVAVDTLSSRSGRANVGVVQVPDPRLDYLAARYKPKKVTHASIEFVDGAARVTQDGGRARFGSDFFSDVRQVDALVHVVRGFESAVGEPATPLRDLQLLADELVLADLQLIETRMQRLEKQLHGVKKGTVTPASIEMGLLERLKSALEGGASLAGLELSHDEDRLVRSYDLLVLKPLIAVLNIPEEEITSPSEQTLEFREHCRTAGIREIEICAQVEKEISEFSDEEEAEFLSSMGISEPARNRLIRECYAALGLISFFTISEPEVRAWTIRVGSKAIDAAGTIHSDMARGFIRAEVAAFADVEAAGGWEEAKQKGLVHLHGKDYVVQDGDVIYIRFHV